MNRATRVYAAAVALVVTACDPVSGNAVDALGGETPGVRRGPLHRPGQPCLLCHDGSIGSPQPFSVAGTVFASPGDLRAVSDATVHLADAKGTSFDAQTNAAGNFYVLPRQWTPHYPMTAQVTLPGGPIVLMHTLIGRDGSCAGCHFDPVGSSSAGHICMRLDDGGTPP